jgi:hypothetical protein
MVKSDYWWGHVINTDQRLVEGAETIGGIDTRQYGEAKPSTAGSQRAPSFSSQQAQHSPRIRPLRSERCGDPNKPIPEPNCPGCQQFRVYPMLQQGVAVYLPYSLRTPFHSQGRSGFFRNWSGNSLTMSLT